LFESVIYSYQEVGGIFMRFKYSVICLFLLVLLFVLIGCSSDEQQDQEQDQEQEQQQEQFTQGIVFTLSDSQKEYIVTGYQGTSKNVIIPPMYNELPVTSISESAFRRLEGIESVRVPKSVTKIGKGAFSFCANLKKIEIPFVGSSIDLHSDAYLGYIFGASSSSNNTASVPRNLKKVIITSGNFIGSGAFKGCSSLEEIVIPNGVTTIYDSAFVNCSSLKTITIPESVTSIKNNILSGCSSLESIVVDANNKNYDSRDNCNAIIKTSENMLLAGCKETTIPDSVTSIGEGAFLSCALLKNITIPNGVTTIGQKAFSNCNSLESIEIPSSVTTIKNSAFFECENLKSVTFGEGSQLTTLEGFVFYTCTSLESIEIPSGVTSIESETFNECINLKSVKIPKSVKVIGNDAFFGCSSLKEVTFEEESELIIISYSAFDRCYSLENIEIPESVTKILDAAFFNCTSLKSIKIPSSVTEIGKEVFGFCISLESIVVDNLNKIYDSRNNCNAIIETATNTLIVGCKDTIVPNGVTTIRMYAFSKNSNLTSIIIPVSVTKIEDFAFANCGNLKTIYYTGSQEEWNKINIASNALISSKVDIIYNYDFE